jgi:hypothetical protein
MKNEKIRKEIIKVDTPVGDVKVCVPLDILPIFRAYSTFP